MRTAPLLLLVAALFGCRGGSLPADARPATPSRTPVNITTSEHVPDEPMNKWARSCVICHVRGEGGAPVVGDKAAWEPRLAQGEDVLLQHTIEGLNNMPPLGYCMDCNTADFRTLIRFMSGSES
jgi:cytochrome c5